MSTDKHQDARLLEPTDAWDVCSSLSSFLLVSSSVFLPVLQAAAFTAAFREAARSVSRSSERECSLP